MNHLAVKVGLSVRQMRKQKGLSQDELALRADIDRSYVGRIERAEANITLDMLYRIAEVLGCEAVDFLPSREELKN